MAQMMPMIDPMDAKGHPQRNPRTYAMVGAAVNLHQRETGLPALHEENRANSSYRADVARFDRAIAEPRALPVQIGDTDQAQTTNYPKASDMKALLLLNFGARTLERHRFIPSQSTTSVTSSRPVDSIIVE